ncbi:RNA polymerase II-associated factor 1 homolog [Littorina saxatilis]|uniref:RNA polymerase II-associated factor 1 homolog n=1 Tax=Littorina saxatilis TaxID=31220 RepID=A0AAN9BEJ7_9CAEN
MPPTIQSGRRPDEREKRQRPGDKRSDLVCRVKYNNTLPDIPFDPKFITYPFESNRFYQYNPTSLERSFKYDLLTEHDLDVTIDLINPDTYKIDPNAYPDVEDEKLLEDELNTPSDSKRSRHHNTNVSWLRKTEYISTEYNRFMQKSDKSESKVGFKMKQQMREEDLYKDRDSQITAIQATFDRAKDPITKHYSKPGVTPVEVLPVYPDFKLWKLPFAQVLFDSDPAADRVSKDIHVQAEEMSQAMIRGAVDESGEQFVAYFLPTEETMGKRKADFEETVDYTPDQVYEYLLAREYNWNVKNKLSKGYEETYFFVFREDGVFYNELETRVRLSKRRKLGSQRMPKSWLEVKHRELNSKEEQAQEVRMTMLEPPQEEEEEEEMQVDEGEKASDQEFKSGSEKGSDAEDNKSDAGSVKSGGSARSRSRSRSKSRSVSRSKSRSRSRSRSRSKSGSRSRSRSRSGSRSPSRSRSRSKSKSKSRSRSRSRSGSRSASSGSEKGSEKGSDVESEAEKEKEKEEERAIFGSDSDSSDNE